MPPPSDTVQQETCTQIVHHLTRIQGQIEALKKYLEDDRSCENVAHLMRSILSSFDGARASIIEEMMKGEFPATREPKQLKRLQSIVSMYKS